ncbi:hypothetical protein Z946_3110 [Sulfitobacter noctilucicola]|nr:hypothetical protein Z946_3110 [Sulfitobacter noctilucicola]
MKADIGRVAETLRSWADSANKQRVASAKSTALNVAQTPIL